jgi:hypothetical protein
LAFVRCTAYSFMAARRGLVVEARWDDGMTFAVEQDDD